MHNTSLPSLENCGDEAKSPTEKDNDNKVIIWFGFHNIYDYITFDL